MRKISGKKDKKGRKESGGGEQFECNWYTRKNE